MGETTITVSDVSGSIHHWASYIFRHFFPLDADFLGGKNNDGKTNFVVGDVVEFCFYLFVERGAMTRGH